ncbi:hypothetical protein MATL_G00062950 [Megalops atlanticus]|uniref:Dynein regulatory complex protein 10 n=1 Tax=Megalops atlanticus TaxID=7932 RepID=A0A9D3TG29_MEGAT|nr:hypothetical protein MATL_G00062950 [Megalops atlanticus]
METEQDSSKAMGLYESKLVTLDIQRNIKVLDECIWKVETVFLLPALLANLDRLSAGRGGELVKVLQEHRLLEEKLATQQQTCLEGKGEEEMNQLAGLEQAFCGSLRNVLRELRAHPAVCQGLSDGGTDEEYQRLVEGLKELQGLLMEKLLPGSAEEQAEQERSHYMQELSLRHRNNMEMVSKLEEEVAAATKDKDAEISKRNEQIRKLKSSLMQMEKQSEEFVTRMQQDAEKQNLSDRKTSEGRCAHMQQEANQLHGQFNNLIAENREVEMTLRKKKSKVETEIENWVQKYDTDMEEKQTELEELSTFYTQETEELQDLEEHYAVLELEYNQIMEERRLAQEQREEEERELVIMHHNAVVIQAYWRGFKVRKAMKSKSKGKKGKKGKGKKNK